MGFGHKIFSTAKSVFSFLLRKTVSVLLFFFLLGMIYAYYLISVGATPLWLAGVALAIPIMWQDLDDGLAFFLLVIVASLVLPAPVL
ncbi:hypothetical protein COX85_01640 [Candidatus Micrarchaeota archaeon CG_4_10_14_0_2_um_filter_55_9]|nr:MAG: hypothetical protein AUJ15_02180 [Candidatus Micrarchaeota archaeon CG1_02_55_41]PIO02846.1 MAG: hypothetical protein COT57_02115 [Candidatus Micrarchaeota archaeon CG09_land_8_20_14_0_10_55_25]PIZ91851.1 MAG: hypothetical protein COX85_01640 [Candidatus Micrarchaeota archaeon CG_4_10_14_0_2_um_filter_55_9]PJD01240.1 MAG: hypothetical protein COU38_02180 [Candidatus Micrarchaeota archaeon CG10_big_fil_rev_8_21_14_0_10_54_18]